MTAALSMKHIKKIPGGKVVDFGGGGDLTSYILIGGKSYLAKGEIILTDKPETSNVTITSL